MKGDKNTESEMEPKESYIKPKFRLKNAPLKTSQKMVRKEIRGIEEEETDNTQEEE